MVIGWEPAANATSSAVSAFAVVDVISSNGGGKWTGGAGGGGLRQVGKAKMGGAKMPTHT